MDLPKKDATQLAQTYASSSDMENVAIGTTYEVKRDLGRRHINMIAIAGMIVGGLYPKSLPACILTRTIFRVLDYSWHPAKQSPPQDQWALSSDTYVWV
jgi:amino acid transporter